MVNNGNGTIVTQKDGIVFICMDLNKIDDACIFGECIKDLSFDGGLYYNSLNPDFEEITESVNGKKFIKKFFNYEGCAAKIYKNKDFYIGKESDGDTTLVISFNGRTVVNTDAKKDYTWEWWKETK